jgi:putative peptide zinc metalloprotease protein
MNLPAPLLSPDWYRIAHMRPRLRSGVRVSRQTVRGEAWYVLSDPISGRHHRFNDIAYGLIGSCDGSASIDEIWSARVTAQGDDAPAQAEAIRVFAQAFAANLFVGDIAPDALAIVRAQQRAEGLRRRAQLNPLALRVPLWDPDQFLDAHLHQVAWLFSFAARVVVGLVIALGALLLLLNAEAVAAFAQRELGSGRMLLTLWLAYPVLKGLHEMAHAFACKFHGGEVHEVGITLLMLTPVPYVDASASVAFADKRRRVDVAAAGIVVEALLASLALALWLVLEPGVLKDIAFAVVFVGALSTLLVNGNPLMRFDGYYILCDAAELPNLAARSNRYWAYLAKRYGLRLGAAQFPGRARGERPWLMAYAPLAWSFRVALLALLAVFAAQWHAGLGIAVLLLGLWACLLKPAWTVLRWVAAAPELRGLRPRAAAGALAAFAAVASLAWGLPLPQRSHAPGVVWLPDDAIARLASDGFVEEFFVQDGQRVEAGTPIARLSNEPLQLELVQVNTQLERQQVERALQFEVDARRAADADDELRRLAAERERLTQRVAALTVKAALAGRIVVDTERVRIGQYLPQGEVIAQVLPEGAPMVRALVRNEDIALVRERPGRIEVQLAHAGDARSATLGQAVPRASTQLPTRALGEAAGGSIALDASDPSGRTAREPHFQVDLKLQGAGEARIGARALVTFRHGEASAAELVGRFLRQSFLRYFEK